MPVYENTYRDRVGIVASERLSVLEEDFVRRVGGRDSADPLRPRTVVVGSNLQHTYLRRLLAREHGAVANVRFLTLIDLAGEIYLSTPAERPLRPLPEGADALILRNIFEENGLDQPDSPLAAHVVGVPEAIAATVRDLREGMVSAADLRKALPSSPKARALATVFEAAKEHGTGFLDRTRLLEEAAMAPADAFDQALPDGPVFVYGIYDLNELQLQLISKVGQSRPVTIFLPWHDGEPSFRFAQPTIERLRSLGFATITLPDGNGGDTVAAPRRLMFSSSDRYAEAEEVARRILADAEEGVPFSDTAVLHHLDQGYDELIAGVLDRAGVPFYIAAGRPVRRTAVGKATLNLLSLVCEEPTRGGLLEFLSLPCITLEWIEKGVRPRPGRWEALSKELGLVKGWDEFEVLLALCLRGTEAGDPGGREEYRREQAASLLQVVGALAEQASKAESLTDWSSLGDWFVSLLDVVIEPGLDRHSLDAVRDRIKLLGVLDAAGVGCDIARFRDTAEKAIRSATVSGGYFQRDGVFVGSVLAARALRFRRVYLTECAERVFPPVIRQDPLLLDVEREKVNAVAEGSLPLKTHRLDEERLLFELARQSARERLVISYARRANLSGTPRLPSSLMLAEAASLTGTFQSIGALERESPVWFARLPSRIGFQGDGPEDALRSLDASDLRFHVLEMGGPRALPALTALWPHYGRVHRMHEGYRADRFGPFDGVVPEELVRESGVLEANLSASSLSDYAVCPYRFFLGKVLGIRVRDEPEETLEIAATDRGSFVHRVLERFVSRFLAKGGSWAEFLASGDKTLAEIMTEEVERRPTGKKGLPFAWETIRQDIESDLREYLDEERQRATSGWQPAAAELWFEDVEIDTGGRTLKVRGAIDRLDRRGKALRVVDYKTGGVWEEPHGYRKGGSLQLPLYLTAACSREGVPLASSEAEFHYVGRKGAFQRLTLTGDALAADDRFQIVLDSMAEGIASGAFFYWPAQGRKNCRFCDFQNICHTQVDVRATAKAPRSSQLMEAWRRIYDDRRRG